MKASELDCEHGGTIYSCPVCRPRERHDPWEDVSTSTYVPKGGFEARYESACPDCGSTMEPGETIFMRDGQAVCEVCA